MLHLHISNVVYVFSCHCRNDCVGRTSQQFHVKREQHVTKKAKMFIFNGEAKPKGDQLSIHELLLNNPKKTTWTVDSKSYREQETLSRNTSRIAIHQNSQA